MQSGVSAQSGAPSDICNFCHTPQGRVSSIPGWETDRQTPQYLGYDTRRPDGSIGLRGSVSVACMSCHDGSQAAEAAARKPYISASFGIQNIPGPMTAGHPVGIVFSGYRPQQTFASATIGLPVNRLQRDVIGNEVRWWLDMEVVPDGVRDKTDVIFYTRDEGAGEQPFIECASCHDPHADPGNMFLRASNAGSNLCQACHNY